MLEIKELSKHFGGLVAVDNVSFIVNKGDILGLIGPNGSGKTTVVNLITGMFPVTKGTIAFQNHPLTGRKPHQIASLGISRTFQLLKLFEDLTLLENVMAGMHLISDRTLVKTLLRFPILKKEKELKDKAVELLEFVGLSRKADDYASSLTYGQGRMLDIARLLATGANMLLLDEPGAGLNSAESEILKEKLAAISARGKSILLIEHDMSLVMSICNRIVVLNNGKKLAEGTPDEIQNNETVIQVYLGHSHVERGAEHALGQ